MPQFLAKLKVMDYSLFVGIEDVAGDGADAEGSKDDTGMPHIGALLYHGCQVSVVSCEWQDMEGVRPSSTCVALLLRPACVCSCSVSRCLRRESFLQDRTVLSILFSSVSLFMLALSSMMCISSLNQHVRRDGTAGVSWQQLAM